MLTREEIIAKEFDRLASTYESNRLAPWYQAQGEEILKVSDFSGPVVALDIGCGTGWLLRQIVKRNPEAFGIGLDLSGEMIRVANDESRDPKSKNLQFIQADWENMETDTTKTISRKQVTHVILASSIHYFSDPLSAVTRIFNLLEPGGRFIVIDRAKDKSILTALWDIAHHTLINDNVKFYRSEEFRQLFCDAGFAEARIEKRIRKLFWKNKLNTSLVLLSAEK